MHRRRFLAGAATASLAGLAGCSGASASIAPPQIPSSKLEAGDWEKRDETQETIFERSYGPVTLTAEAYSLVYEDVGLRAEIEEKTLDQVSGQFSLFSATRVNFDPNVDNLPAGVGTGQILDRTEENARQQFESQMSAAGLSNVQQADTGTLAIDTGEDARLTSYTAEFPFQTIEFPVADGKSITVEGDPISVVGDLAVWHHGEYVLVAGGAYPGENFARTISKDLSPAISVTVDLDLGLTPDAYRDEVRGLIAAVK
jgi:hypothetical protein